MSSNKKNKSIAKKPSVFERLGSKPSMVAEEYCKQWAHKGTCSYLNKCKYIETHNSKNYKNVTPTKDAKKKSRSRSRSPIGRKDVPSSKTKLSSKPVSKAIDNGDWEKSLENEDEIALERKLQMLQRELAKQEEQEHKSRVKIPVGRKRERSSSTSSSSSSSSSETSSDSSDTSSSSSGSSTTSSSSSSDSDGEVKDKRVLRDKKKSSRAKASLKIHGIKGKVKGKSRKMVKLSPTSQGIKKKDVSAKKQSRGITSPKRLASASKHGRESPTFSARSRSPRTKESDLLSRERRHRRSPEPLIVDSKRKTDVASRRRSDDLLSPPIRERSRDDRKLGSVSTVASGFDVRGKMEGPRERLLEPEYIMRSRSPIPVHGYRDPYARELSPTMYRERRTGEPYDSRRVYSPPMIPKSEIKDDLYDSRLRRPISPDPLRRPMSARKDYRDYEHDWLIGSDQTKLEWEHMEYRRRGRPIDDPWNRTEVPWKKGYSPPPVSYPEALHPSRTASWDTLPKSIPVRSDEPKRERRNGPAESRRTRVVTAKRPVEPAKIPTPTPASSAVRSEDGSSPVEGEVASATSKIEEIAESRPGSSAVEIEDAENLSDFSDDVDEILNRDIEEPESEKMVEFPTIENEELEQTEVSMDGETRVPADGAQNLDVSSPRPASPLPTALENRNADDDLLGGMDIEQISDEEFEDEARTTTVDALEVDWTSLACKREKKGESTTIGARQRWQGKAILARLGVLNDKCSEEITVERKPVFDSNALLTRALSARMDLALRRSICNFPVRELSFDCGDFGVNLYKASVELFLKDRS